MTMGKVILLILLVLALIAAAPAVWAFVLMARRPPLTLYEQRRKQADFTPFSRIPRRQIDFLLALEDSYFYSHRGFRIAYIRAAMKRNIQARRIVWGGSSITQQLAKNLYFHFARSIFRKCAELWIAVALERILGKERILEMYINIIYYGYGVYGITEAAHFYFEKQPWELSMNQMFMLAAIPAVPTAGNPIAHPEAFIHSRDTRLGRLMKSGTTALTQAEAEQIMAHGPEGPDPELRPADDYTRSYPATIPMVNERFGPTPQGIWKDMPYTDSPLAQVTILSPNHSWLRTHPIDRITPHCMLGQYTAEELGERFAQAATRVSSNYAIDRDGRVALYVQERNRSWCSSSRENDHRAVTIECASDAEEPYAFRDAVYRKLIDLCEDICRRNGKRKLLWLGDREATLAYEPAEDEMVLTVHRWFSSKTCPGTWMFARMGDLAEQVTARLKGA